MTTRTKYRVAVNFGGWVTYERAIIHARNDAEAVAQFSNAIRFSSTLQMWKKYGIALFCGDRLVLTK